MHMSFSNWLWRWLDNRGRFGVAVSPMIVAAVFGYYGGSSLCEALLLSLDRSPAQARFIGAFIGGVVGGLLCAGVVGYLMRGWIKRLVKY